MVLGGTGVISSQVEHLLSTYADEVVRIGGSDRYDTSARVSAAAFRPGVAVAYLATGRDFADSLSGGPVAGRERGPILLAEPDRTPEPVLDGLQRLRPGRIVVLGGPHAVSEDVPDAAATLTDGSVHRLAGADRYGTSAAVTAAAFPDAVSVVYIATGARIPYALAATPVVHAHGAALVLVRRDSIPAEIAAELRRLAPSRIIVLGGPHADTDGIMAGLGMFSDGN